MNIAVAVKQVPDLAEELEIGPDGTDLDREWLTYVINEFDDHALEEALQLKEAVGGSVVVLGLGVEGMDDVLYTCLAKGADRAIRVGEFDGPVSSHAAAAALAGALGSVPHDMVLTGVQAIDDLDGQVGPLLAATLGVPHVSVVTHIAPGDGTVTVNQEYAGGVVAEFDVELPAVLGVQAARAVPRYAPISRVRQVQQTAEIEAVPADATAASGVTVRRLYAPESGGRATMLDGGAEAAAARLVEIFRERGVLRS